MGRIAPPKFATWARTSPVASCHWLRGRDPCSPRLPPAGSRNPYSVRCHIFRASAPSTGSGSCRSYRATSPFPNGLVRSPRDLEVQLSKRYLRWVWTCRTLPRFVRMLTNVARNVRKLSSMGVSCSPSKKAFWGASYGAKLVHSFM